jgi:Tfp pilus assembly protein PilN
MVIVGFNLATSNYRRNRHALLLLCATGLVLTVLLAAQLFAWLGQRRENQGVETRLAAAEAEFSRHQSQAQAVRSQTPPETIKQYEAKVVAYNHILEATTFSWIGLLVELERSVPPGVTVSAIQPDLSSGKVALRGEARTFEDLTKLLTNLEQRTGFRNVFLLNHSARKAGAGSTNGLDFSVNLVYEGRAR